MCISPEEWPAGADDDRLREAALPALGEADDDGDERAQVGTHVQART